MKQDLDFIENLLYNHSTTDYLKYRGKCKTLSEEYIKENPEYELVRGWYMCPFWGKQQHFWTQHKQTHEIVDPSKDQFPSKGMGEYIKFNGYFECEACGKKIHEDDAYYVDQHIYCSYICYGYDVM